jgi:hypothetical protein
MLIFDVPDLAVNADAFSAFPRLIEHAGIVASDRFLHAL